MRWLIFCLALTGGLAIAHHPDDLMGVNEFTVVAAVEAEPANLDELRRNYLVLGYVWRQRVAVIQGDSRFLPAGARIDKLATDRLTTSGVAAVAPYLDLKGGGIAGFPCYRTVEQTQADLASLAQSHPQLAEWVDYGDSWVKTQGSGGYDLNALILTNRLIEPTATDPPKPVLMIMAAMHARELATAETATRFAEYLISGYGVDPDITWILDYTEIHILPQHNPDGRKQAETGLSWRKNTNENYCSPASNSRGADLNRNSSTLFWGQGPNGNTCGTTYQGPVAGSEPETAGLEAYQIAGFPDQREGDITVGAAEDAQGIFISLHSFGEFVFYPWEGVDTDTGNETGYRSLSQRLAFITGYAACQNCCLGTAAGTAVDFAYEEFGVASFTFELGTSFFQSCSAFENEIWPVNRDALMYAAKAARRPYISSNGPVVGQINVTIDETAETAQLSVQANDSSYAVNNVCPPIDATRPDGTIADITWTADSPPWQVRGQAMTAQDGSFDSTTESATATLTLANLGSGRHLIFVRATDDNGNAGPPSTAFIEIPVLFVDDFEPDPQSLSISHKTFAAGAANQIKK